MYPGNNNYDSGYPYQQPGYNMPPQSYGNQSSYPGGNAMPQIGFNVGPNMNNPTNYAPGYGPPPSSYGSYDPYPTNPANQQHCGAPLQTYPTNTNNSFQGYQAPNQQYAPQNPYPSGNFAPQYQQTPCAPASNLGYTDTSFRQTPSYGESSPSAYCNPPQRPQPINPSLSSNPSTTDYGSYSNQQMNLNCIGTGGETYRGTIKPYPNFHPEQDCNILKKAMKGLGTDEKAIIECLGRRNLSQRLEIKKTFKTMFGKDLIEELKSEISGNFCRVVTESLYDADYYDAYSLCKAMEGAGTREDVLTEILTSRSNQQIENIKDIYKKHFNKILEKEVISETSGFYKRVLVSCLQANKKELTGDEIMRLRQFGPSSVVNANQARQEAQELYNAGEKKIGTDEACFIKIFATRNKYQLKATFEEYKRISGRDIITSIEREMSGDLASSLKAIATQAINPAAYFATRLYYAMKGAGTNDTALIRILLTRSEIDLENIKSEFQAQFGKTLDSFVRGDTSGDYMKYLIRFVEGN